MKGVRKVPADLPLTVGDCLCVVSPSLGGAPHPPKWPPDAFALVAALLRRADAYVSVLEKWPPKWPKKLRRRVFA